MTNRSIVVRDPVHGDIELTPAQLAVFNSCEMQRLRGIKQLGAAYLVYPGCTHTRFEHSLGAMFASQRIIAALRHAGHSVSAEDEEMIGIAALLHDITHMPFGHTLEDERGVLPRHDTVERLLPVLSNGDIGSTLQQLGITQVVSSLLTNKSDWRAQLVAGSIDADLLDYLRRDSYYAGISQDYDDRVYSYFCLADGQLAVNLAKRGMDRPDAFSEVIHLLRMRYFLTERVYLHHAKMAAGVMISRAVELCLAEGTSIDFLRSLTDEGLLLWLAGRFAAPLHAEAAELAENVMTRKLYKRAFGLSGPALIAKDRMDLSSRFHGNSKECASLSAHIADKAGVPAKSVIVHCTGNLPFRELSIPAYTRYGLHPLNHPPKGSAPYPDISALEAAYANLWRFWVFAQAEVVDVVATATCQELGYRNELR